MNPTVYFADKTLRFVSSASDAEGFPVAAECGPNRDKILKILETHNSVSVVAAESLAACAEREIVEETGIAARVERPLCETLHAYWFAKTARWELKRTHWFRLRPAGAGIPAPQTEEGIERVSWCAPAEREEHLRDAFPTIRRVAAAMEE